MTAETAYERRRRDDRYDIVQLRRREEVRNIANSIPPVERRHGPSDPSDPRTLSPGPILFTHSHIL